MFGSRGISLAQVHGSSRTRRAFSDKSGHPSARGGGVLPSEGFLFLYMACESSAGGPHDQLSARRGGEETSILYVNVLASETALSWFGVDWHWHAYL